MFDYYLGWLTGGGASAPHFEFLDTSTVPFAREWGMETALGDARKVVRAAHRGGREVILGGHSLGASLTAAYAAWDFNGRPGYKDLAGLVLIDGGLLGSFDAYDLGQAQQQIADLETSDPFLDLLGIGIPEAAGLFAEVGGIYARLDPTAPATTTQNFPLLPGRLQARHPGDQPRLARARVRQRHLAAGARAVARQRRLPGAGRRPARLGRRGRHPDRPPGGDVRPGAGERDRVVLPEAADDRHQRRRPDEDERRRQRSSACG